MAQQEDVNVIRKRPMVCDSKGLTTATLWEDEEGTLYETCDACGCLTWACEVGYGEQNF